MSMIVDLKPSIKYIYLIENIFISCSKIDSCIGSRKIKYAFVKVCFQSHVNITCKYNLSLLVTFSSFWSSLGHIVITNDNPGQKYNPAYLASEFLKLFFLRPKGWFK